MFKKVTNQSVSHSDGYSVSVIDRETIEYMYNDFSVRINTDMTCKIIPLYKESVEFISDINQSELPKMDHILKQVQNGLKKMGLKSEIVD